MNIELKKKKERRNYIIRQLLYIILVALSYTVISTIGSSSSVPALLIPLAVCYAVREAPFNSALFGCVCGLFLDSASDTLIGFNAIILMWTSLFISLLFHYYLRRHIFNFLLLDFLVTALQSLLHYLLFYVLWDYDKSGNVFSSVFIPVAIYTNISGAVLFWLTGVISMTFGTVTEHYIEEKSEDIVRE